MRRRTWRAAAALVAAGSLVALVPACSAHGSDHADAPATTSTERSTTPSSTTDRPSKTTTTAPSSSAGPVDPTQDDVTDAVFSGQGDPRIDVSHYDVVLTASPPSRQISGRVQMDLAATTAQPLASFTLDLRGPKVRAAQIDGKGAKVTAHGAQIVVVPAEPLRPHRSAHLVMAYAGTPEPTSFPRLGVKVGWQYDRQGGAFTMSEPNGTSTWVPVNDHPSDKATWKITLNTPGDLVGVANGRLTASHRGSGSDSRSLWEWTSAQPMASYLAFVAIGAYDLVERPGPDGIHLTFAYPKTLSEKRRAGFAQLDEILHFYRSQFGPYPFKDSGAAVVTSSLGLALESQTRPLFGDDAIGDGVVWALPHEVAHQWFGDAVSPARWQDVWLNESFATYANWLWTSHKEGTPMKELADEQTIPRRGQMSVTDPEAAESFDGAVYEGGARALQALRMTVGDEVFFQILRQWYAENSGKSVTTEDFIATAEKVSKRDLTSFFDAWLRSPKQPALPG